MTLNLMVNNMPVEAYCSDRDVKEIFIPLLKRLQRIAEEKQGRALMMLAAPPAAGKSTLLKVLKIISEEMPDMPPVEIIGIDGCMISIDTIAIENEVADNLYQRSELDWLIYNKPLEYAQLVLDGDLENYLKGPTVHKLED